MVQCCNCGKRITEPEKRIENSAFCIELYKCPQCGETFKHIS